ncbi:MAG: ubiquinol-cytochrome c reductase iron-sulfur subunit [Epsilonproteobacteria bacterium]|nr:ubiquinol-cytochrome c reductase iron-sulfur subunit [Campylobacterota bacterium]
MGDKISRRKFLGRATCVAGGIGAVSAVYPAVASLAPDKAALAQSMVKFDISGLKELKLATVPYKGKPLFVMKFPAGFTPEKWGGQDQENINYKIMKPLLAKQKNVVAIIGVCTHLGCIPIWEKNGGKNGIPVYYCPCHGGVYTPWGDNIAGPPPIPLHIPKQKLVGNTLIVG